MYILDKPIQSEKEYFLGIVNFSGSSVFLVGKS